MFCMGVAGVLSGALQSCLKKALHRHLRVVALRVHGGVVAPAAPEIRWRLEEGLAGRNQKGPLLGSVGLKALQSGARPTPLQCEV